MSVVSTHTFKLCSSNPNRAMHYYLEFFTLGVGIKSNNKEFTVSGIYKCLTHHIIRTHNGQGFTLTKKVGQNKLISLSCFIYDKDKKHIHFELKVYPRFKAPFVSGDESQWFLQTILHDTFHFFDPFIILAHRVGVDSELEKFFTKQAQNAKVDWKQAYEKWNDNETTLKDCIYATKSLNNETVSIKTAYNMEQKLKKEVGVCSLLNRAIVLFFLERIRDFEIRIAPYNFIGVFHPRDLHYCDQFVEDELKILKTQIKGIIPGRFQFVLRKAG